MNDAAADKLWTYYLPRTTPEEIADMLGGELIHACYQYVDWALGKNIRPSARHKLAKAILWKVYPIIERREACQD